MTAFASLVNMGTLTAIDALSKSATIPEGPGDFPDCFNDYHTRHENRGASNRFSLWQVFSTPRELYIEQTPIMLFPNADPTHPSVLSSSA